MCRPKVCLGSFSDGTGLRLDGRREKELRQIKIEVGTVSSADGSAFVQQGNTKVLATVYGPHEVVASVEMHL